MNQPKAWGRALVASLLFVVPGEARAATLDGAPMTWPYALPFAGLLLSIAAGPMLFAKVWHRHYGKIASAWALLTLRLAGRFRRARRLLAALVHAGSPNI